MGTRGLVDWASRLNQTALIIAFGSLEGEHDDGETAAGASDDRARSDRFSREDVVADRQRVEGDRDHLAVLPGDHSQTGDIQVF